MMQKKKKNCQPADKFGAKKGLFAESKNILLDRRSNESLSYYSMLFRMAI